MNIPTHLSSAEQAEYLETLVSNQSYNQSFFSGVGSSGYLMTPAIVNHSKARPILSYSLLSSRNEPWDKIFQKEQVNRWLRYV